MPSGRIHDRITWLSFPPLALFGYLLTSRGDWILWFSGAYVFSGLMFGPDLDIYSLQYKRWGVIRWIWLPYQSCLKHRSFLSHGFLVGTLVRLIYLTMIVLIVSIFGVAIAQLIIGFNWNWQAFIQHNVNLIINQYFAQAITIFIGLELGAMSHSLSDYLVTRFKRSQPQKLKQILNKQVNSRALKKRKKRKK